MIRTRAFPIIGAVYLASIFGLPLAVVVALLSRADTLGWRLLAGLFAPLIYASLVLVVAGVLSLPHQKGVLPGRFPRKLSHPVYFHRRLYGLCWTAVYYFTPVYFLCLSLPWLKWLTFRLFGYRGSMAFTVYPDTWIRDLPLLSFGKGVYVSNRATLGTNIVMANGGIVVDQIKLDDGALIGHLAMLAPGVHVGRQASVGVGCGVGLRARIGERARIGAMAGIGHDAQVGRRARIGDAAIIGPGATVDSGVVLPQGAIIPPRRLGDTTAELVTAEHESGKPAARLALAG